MFWNTKSHNSHYLQRRHIFCSFSYITSHFASTVTAEQADWPLTFVQCRVIYIFSLHLDIEFAECIEVREIGAQSAGLPSNDVHSKADFITAGKSNGISIVVIFTFNEFVGFSTQLTCKNDIVKSVFRIQCKQMHNSSGGLSALDVPKNPITSQITSDRFTLVEHCTKRCFSNTPAPNSAFNKIVGYFQSSKAV